VRVDSSNPVVRDRVEAIARVVTEHGGFVHPELVIHHHQSSLWMSLPRSANPHYSAKTGLLDRPHATADPLLLVPDELHVPVSDLDWEPHDSVLRYRAETSHLTNAQQVILDAMVDLFNAVDKVRQIGANYPVLATKKDPTLHDLIRAGRPSFASDSEEGSADTPTAPSLLVVRSRLRSARLNPDEDPTDYFMPMIDMLNHHPYGSRYRRNERGDWRIDIHHPTHSDQVFVRYNKYDAFGTALSLGYVETDTRFVASVACDITVSGVGVIKVKGASERRRRLSAPHITRTDEGLTLNGLVLDAERLPNLQALLAMPMRMLAVDPQPAVAELLQGVLNANAEYYERLLAECSREVESQADVRTDIRGVLADVSRHQLKLLERFAGSLAAAQTNL
jgi:hypothetical protein